MPGRKGLRLTALVLIFVFAISAAAWAAGEAEPDKVITGKDGWYFYDSERSIEDYQGTDLFTEDELKNIRERLMTAKNFFDERGIQFIIFPSPNKEHVYSEYMPDEYGPLASYTRIEQLCDYLRDEFTILSPLSSLLTAKQLWPQYYYYYKTDTHWNELGAYIAAWDLMNVIGPPLPDFSSLKISPLICDGRDLAQALGIEKSVTDNDYLPDGYGPYRAEAVEIDDESNYIHYYAKGAPAKNMIIFGDSFGMVMAPYLAQNYENIYLHRFTYTRSMIDLEQPSVVVYELVERSLDGMLMFQIYDE